MQHEPSGLLSDLHSSGDLVGANPVPTVDNHPDSSEPFIERDGRILEYALGLDAKLLVAIRVEAFPYTARLEERTAVALAMRTHNPVRPAHLRHELDAGIHVCEVPDRSEQMLWQTIARFLWNSGFCKLRNSAVLVNLLVIVISAHVSTIPLVAWCVNYIYAVRARGGHNMLWFGRDVCT